MKHVFADKIFVELDYAEEFVNGAKVYSNQFR